MKQHTYLNLHASRSRSLAFTSLGIASVLLAWAGATYSGFIPALFLPTPTAVVEALGVLFTDFNLLGDIGASVARIGIGFVLSVIIGVPLGIYLGTNKAFEAYVEALMSFLRYIPVSAVLPLFMLWFGIGETEKILLIFAGVLPNLVLMVFDVVANVRREFTEAAYSLGAGNRDILTSVIFPQSLPGIWDAMRINIGLAWTFVILAEVVAASSGLGHVIITSQRFLQTPNVMAAILVIGVLGLVIDASFKFAYKVFFPWTAKSYV